MTAGDPISDEDLTAYLDGEADRELGARIEERLAVDAGLARRLEALTIDKGALKAEAERLLREAPRPLLPANTARAPAAWALAASLAIGAALGAGAFAILSPEPGLEDWRDFAAAYHTLYVAETLAPLETSAERSAYELARVGAAINRPLDGAAVHPALLLKRAQVLGHEGAAIAHLAYTSETGVPLALCVIADAGGAAPVSLGTREGIATAEWSDGTHQFILIGRLPEGELRAAAQGFAEGV